MEEAGRRDSAREMTRRRRWRGGGEGGKGQIRRMGDTEETFGERWDVEGCGDQNGKIWCGNSLEKFFLKSRRKRGKSEKFGGFNQFLAFCQRAGIYRIWSTVSTWGQLFPRGSEFVAPTTVSAKESSVPKGFHFKPRVSFIKHFPLSSRPFIYIRIKSNHWSLPVVKAVSLLYLWLRKDKRVFIFNTNIKRADFKHFCQHR